MYHQQAIQRGSTKIKALKKLSRQNISRRNWNRRNGSKRNRSRQTRYNSQFTPLRCRDGVKVLWCHSHLVWLVLGGYMLLFSFRKHFVFETFWKNQRILLECWQVTSTQSWCLNIDKNLGHPTQSTEALNKYCLWNILKRLFLNLDPYHRVQEWCLNVDEMSHLILSASFNIGCTILANSK